MLHEMRSIIDTPVSTETNEGLYDIRWETKKEKDPTIEDLANVCWGTGDVGADMKKFLELVQNKSICRNINDFNSRRIYYIIDF